MKVTRILAALALTAAFAGAAHAQGCVRLTWGPSCDPWVKNANWPGQTVYQLVESVIGVSAPNVGTDSQIRIKHGYAPDPVAVPDSWRFDDAGCQTGSQLTLNTNAASKLCPAMKGLNSLTITQYATDVDGSAFLRLAITYDTFTPSAGTRYTLWNVLFDHTFSVAGPSDPGLTCGGAELCENFSIDFAQVLAQTGQAIPLPGCDSDPLLPGVAATWNGGCEPPVATLPATWGKVKGLYR